MKLVKIEELPNAEYPNNKPVGYTVIGDKISELKVGECFYIMNTKRFNSGMRTSIVQEIIDENTFKTCNSIYKIIKDETS